MSALEVGTTRGEAVASAPAPPLREFRVVIEAADWDAAVRFYRDALGLRVRLAYANDDTAQMILEMPAGTIELVHPTLPKIGGESDVANARGPRSPRVRFAVESEDPQATIDALVLVGAEPLADAGIVPTDSLSGRVFGPDGMPVTVFHTLSEPDFSEPPPRVGV